MGAADGDCSLNRSQHGDDIPMSETTARPDRDSSLNNREHILDAIRHDAVTMDLSTLDGNDFFHIIKPRTLEKSGFSTAPEVLLEQAQRIEVWNIPQTGGGPSTADAQGETEFMHFLLLARDTNTHGAVDGCEVVAYPCDSVGKVYSWSHRYVSHGVNFNMAAQKLRFSIINGLATLQHVENT